MVTILYIYRYIKRTQLGNSRLKEQNFESFQILSPEIYHLKLEKWLSMLDSFSIVSVMIAFDMRCSISISIWISTLIKRFMQKVFFTKCMFCSVVCERQKVSMSSCYLFQMASFRCIQGSCSSIRGCRDVAEVSSVLEFECMWLWTEV